MLNGLVSTIIPVFNRPQLIREAVASVLAQTYRPIEIILIDDGSTDDTPEVVKALHQNHPTCIRALRTDNTGPGLAREAGRLIAQGEYIQYLDSDDLLLERKFELQVEALLARSECKVSYGMTRYRHADGSVEPSAWKRSGERIAKMFPSFLKSRWWDTPNPLYRASVCDMAGPWSNLKVEEDWEYDCRIAAIGAPLCYVPEYICEVRDHSEPRLCRDYARVSEQLRHRLEAHKRIYRHATDVGIDEQFPEMQHFARECFLLARQCGAAGLPAESRTFFELARTASGMRQKKSFEFFIYRAGAAILGWELVGSLSSQLDKLRK
jgi:glycosyltransferase involved in cell wall biosynthesis